MVWNLEDEGLDPKSIQKLGPEHYHQSIYKNEKYSGIRQGFHPPCYCSKCSHQFRGDEQMSSLMMKYSEALSDEEARVKVAQLTQKIASDQEYLKNQCELNGNVILKKWKKTSMEHRKEALLAVDPNLYPRQWCEARAWYKHMPRHKKKLTLEYHLRDPDINMAQENRHLWKTWLLPYLNLESLSLDPLRLLHLLYNRAKYSPAQWAVYDDKVIDQGWKSGVLRLSWNANCIVMHGENYGSLTNFEQDAAHRWDAIGYPRGILILEAQEILMGFLRKMVENLLRDVKRDDQVNQSDRFLEVVEGGSRKHITGNIATNEFESVYINQPFDKPPSFDIQKLLSIATTRIALHEDHLELLQLDPQYMRQRASNIIAGALDDTMTKQNKYVATTIAIVEDINYLWYWQWIVEEVKKLERSYTPLKASIQPGQPLPASFEKALGSLEEFLYDQVRRRMASMAATIPVRPGFCRSWKVRVSQHDQSLKEGERQITVVHLARRDQKTLPPEFFISDRLEYCVLALVGYYKNESYMDGICQNEFATHFAMLEDHLSTASKEDRSRLDEVLYQQFSDLAAVDQMISIVKSHRPNGRPLSFEEAKRAEGSKGWRYINRDFLDEGYQSRYSTRIRREPDWKNKVCVNYNMAGLMEKFMQSECPKGNRISQKWLDQDEAQRTALSNFWNGLRDRHQTTLWELGFGYGDLAFDLSTISADLRQEHIDAVKAQREEIQAAIKEQEEKKAAKKALTKSEPETETQTQWGPQTEEELLVLAEEKLKPKTRGTTDIQPPLPLADLEINEQGLEPLVEPIQLSKRTLATIRAMFPSPASQDRRSVDWDAFVHAMAEVPISFIARHTAGGSAVDFEPDEKSRWFGKGKIVFHKPHPDKTLDPIMLVGMGKRMKKWFGWKVEDFELKK